MLGVAALGQLPLGVGPYPPPNLPAPEPGPTPAEQAVGGGGFYHGPAIIRRQQIADMIRAAERVEEAKSQKAARRARREFLGRVAAARASVERAEASAASRQEAIRLLGELEATKGLRGAVGDILLIVQQIEMLAPALGAEVVAMMDDEDAIMAICRAI